MKMSKHTPGPWALEEYLDDTDEGCFRMRRVISEKNRATIVSDEYGLNEANARLIAAAPDLLTACKLAQEVLDRQGITLGDLGYAIQKAEGSRE